MRERYFYIGIDLQEDSAMLSFYTENQKEPETMGTVAGSEVYQIPMVVTKRKGIGQWFFGEDAKRMAAAEGTEAIEHLLKRAIQKEVVSIEDESYEAVHLLGLFLKKLLLLPNKLGNPMLPDKLVIVRESLKPNEIAMFEELLPQLGLTAEQFMLIDKKESFYYYLYHQEEELWLHDVFLFDYGREKLRYFIAEKNKRTVPQLIVLEEGETEIAEREKDSSFYNAILGLFRKRIVSSVFLIGDGFDGKWMQRSLAELCRGRRVFMGKNLYSKGACYAAMAKENPDGWNFVYMGDGEVKMNLFLKVRKKGVEEFYTLISAGESWYDVNRVCEVLLEGTPEIDFWIQSPHESEAKVETLELSDLPKRPDKMTRLRIQVKPQSDHEVEIKIRDLGFGEIWKSSEKSWEYRMEL